MRSFDIWWQWSWNFWRAGFELNFDLRDYRYFSLEVYPLFFGVRLYIEW